MAASDKELELNLMEAGNKLLEPPSSVDDLLILLDQVENCLVRVEQSPSQSMQNSLSPSLKALVTEKLFRHPDDDVKVAVASCISEITRITAPDAPYDDDQMKEVFQMIVSSFENLSDKSSRSFSKRTSILETVAKVRSCVVMLDLECDDLIIEMFQHFLKSIRDYHAEAVFTSMMTIMTLVLEESEEISTELLSPILAILKKDNEEVLPIAQRLAEKVLESCASKLKPYLLQAVRKLGIPLDDYSSVVSSICQETPVAAEQNDASTEKHVDEERKPAEAPLNEEAQEDKEISKEVASAEQVDVANDKSPKSVVSNGNVKTTISLADSNSLKKQEDESPDKSKTADASSVAEPDKLEAEKAANSESKSEQSAEEKGKKSDSKSTEPSDNSQVEEKEPETLTDHKNDVKDDAGISHGNRSVDGAVSLESEIETEVKPSSPKATENEPTNVVSPTPSVTIPDESRSKKTSQPKKKENSKKEVAPVDDVSKKISEGSSDSEAKATKKISEVTSDSEAKANKKISKGTRDPEAKANKKISERTSDSEAKANKKISEGTSDSEAKANKRSGKKAAIVVSNEDNAPADVDEAKTESGIASDSGAKPLKQSSKKVDAISNNADGSSSKQLDNKKKRARGKLVTEKDGAKSATKNNDEETPASAKLKPNKGQSHLEETPKANSKRKHTPSKQKASGSIEYGENLVGSKVKVYWPKDRAYYDGVIEFFDSVKKKHKVHYNDGDEEILNLKKERWEFIEDESGVDEDEAADHSGPDNSSEMSQKKKAKTADLPSKKSKMDASPKRGGGASSGKSKGATSKSARKTKEETKVDGKSKDGSKSASKSENDNVSKAKDPTPKSVSKSVEVALKIGNKSKNEESGETSKSSKSKDDDSLPLKASLKSKQDTSKTSKPKPETPKSASNSKGKLLKSGGKSNANGISKSKPGSSKAKDSEITKESSIDSAKVPEGGKRKSPISGKGQGSDSKSGKKRRR